MESKFLDLRAEEMDYLNGGGIFGWIVKFIVSAGIAEALVDFGNGFSESYEDANKIGG